VNTGTVPLNTQKFWVTKFLVSRDGRVIKRYEPTDKMNDVETDIAQQVKQQ
jgi:glutathione peroxidase-family protein